MVLSTIEKYALSDIPRLSKYSATRPFSSLTKAGAPMGAKVILIAVMKCLPASLCSGKQRSYDKPMPSSGSAFLRGLTLVVMGSCPLAAQSPPGATHLSAQAIGAFSHVDPIPG